jgi:hypothetical protein
LQKDPARRLRDMRHVRIEIEDTPPEDAATPTAPPSRRSVRERVAWITATLAIGLVAVGEVRYFRGTSDTGPEMRVEISTPPTSDPISLAISPDGRKVVFVGTSEGRQQLWLRPLASPNALPIGGTDGASFPFWSPDSRSIGFFASGTLKRIDIAGGAAKTVANAPTGRGGTWNQDGVILFAPTNGSSGTGTLYRVSAAVSRSK